MMESNLAWLSTYVQISSWPRISLFENLTSSEITFYSNPQYILPSPVKLWLKEFIIIGGTPIFVLYKEDNGNVHNSIEFIIFLIIPFTIYLLNLLFLVNSRNIWIDFAWELVREFTKSIILCFLSRTCVVARSVLNNITGLLSVIMLVLSPFINYVWQ